MDDESDDLDERMIAWVYRNVSDRDEPAKQEQTLSLLLSTGWTYDVETWGWPKGRDAAEVLVATAFYQAAVDDLGGTPEAKAEAAAAYTVLACRRAASDAGNYFDNSRWHGWAALLVGADRYEPKSPETIVEKLKATAPTKCGGPLQSGGTALRNEIRRCANPDAGDAPPPTASPVPPSTPTVAAAAPPASASSSSSSWPDVAPASWPFFDPDRIYPCPAPEEAP